MLHALQTRLDSSELSFMEGFLWIYREMCMQMLKDRQTHIHTGSFILHRLHLIRVTWTSVGCRLPLGTQLSPSETSRLTSTLSAKHLPSKMGDQHKVLDAGLGSWTPSQESHQAGSVDVPVMGAYFWRCKWWMQTTQGGRAAHRRCSGTASFERCRSSGLTQYILRNIYAVFTAHSTVATSKV